MNKVKAAVFLSVIILFIFNSCNTNRHADKIFYNGKIYLVDNNFSEAEAFAVSNGRIRAIGNNDDILDDYQATEKIDLKGATVFPGFIDAHCHFYGYASDLMKCDLYGSISFDEVIDRLIEYSKTNKFSWILGRGWDQNDWADKNYPSNEKLDSLFPDIPVFIVRVDGHAALCNTKALAIAGITSQFPVDGGEIVTGEEGLTGLLIDNAVDIVKKKIPVFDKAILEESLLKAQANCFSVGLTTVDDAGIGKDSIFQMIELQKSGKLKIRIYAMISDDRPTLNYFLEKGPYKDERMNINSIKVYADGAMGSRGACMKKEYSDMQGHYGYLLHSKEYFDQIADEALEAGFQLCTHAIGDSANKVIIDVYKNHLTGDNHRRWRIEHCQVLDPKDRKSMGEYSILPSVQPTHATSDMYWAEERIGKERMKYAYAYEDIRDECDGYIAFGTDFPVEKIDPINTFYAAVVRKDKNNFPPDGFQTENRIKRKDAIKAMTIQAAFANFEEEEKGSLEEGKYADFIILDRDLMNVDDEKILRTRVLATYVNGEKVYELKE